jgi:hypothetical protein
MLTIDNKANFCYPDDKCNPNAAGGCGKLSPADYYAFLAFEEQVHLPQMKRFGLTLVGGWNVAVGATPYVIDETRADNLATIGEMLEKPAYQKLTLKLLQLVSNYGCKILVPSGHINS